MTHFVDPDQATALNLRATATKGKVVAVLPQGTQIAKISEHHKHAGWWRVRAILSGRTVEGFVNSKYLRAGVPPVALAAPVVLDLPPADLPPDASRSIAAKFPFPLSEPDLPTRTGTTHAARAQSLVGIIDYLNPENPAHLRYKKKISGDTYCNIYAYDYCRCAGAYLPRVWWYDSAIREIRKGNVPPALYGNTVREMRANDLHDWFLDFGLGFGWRREFDLTLVQEAANDGMVCIIAAKRKAGLGSGHILAVVPEHRGIVAYRVDGAVERPVQSEAGANNHRAYARPTRWWASASQFESFAFWVHD